MAKSPCCIQAQPNITSQQADASFNCSTNGHDDTDKVVGSIQKSSVAPPVPSQVLSKLKLC
eukprot:1684585-Amphidinium_carterae.2